MTNNVTLMLGDCIDKMKTLPDSSVDSIITDPPYAFPGGFMGKGWDNFDGQEDAAFGYWFAGFTDGEGHFRVQKHERGTHTCAFQLKLRDDDLAALERIKRFVGYGSISFVEGDGSSNRQAVYVIQNKDGCDRLVSIFRKYPLTAKKALDFEIWAEAVEEWLERPRGNRWYGAADQTRAAILKARLEDVRRYTDTPWSGNNFQDWVRQWAKECLRVLKPGGHILAFGSPKQYHRLAAGIEDAGFEIRDQIQWIFGSGFPKSHNLKGEWEGWGTALKPAHEPICVARKPLAEKTVASNVLKYGTGGINIDECRVPVDPESDSSQLRTMNRSERDAGRVFGKYTNGDTTQVVHTEGRWPANIIHDSSAEVLELFPTTTSGKPAAKPKTESVKTEGWGNIGINGHGHLYGDTGSAARFFYCAKASKKDRGEGNNHPTVKPQELMKYLVRLVTPPNGIVLDPFMGSGSTGVACQAENFGFIGIEQSEEYFQIAQNRLERITLESVAEAA
jgi:site-specific DNA-methyltransferase (adenine-specific)